MIDALTRAKEKIDELKIPLTTISALTGISVTDLSGIFTRQRPCGSEKELKIDAAIKALASLAKEIAPIPIDYRKADVLRGALDRIEDGSLRTLVVDLDE